MRERATQTQLVFQFVRVFEGMSENSCVHVLSIHPKRRFSHLRGGHTMEQARERLGSLTTKDNIAVYLSTTRLCYLDHYA